MAVVKSDGYGHGLIPTARAAIAGGATWLGVNSIDEAVRLRRAGVTVPVLCMLTAPGASHADGVSFDVDLSVATVALVRRIGSAAEQAGRPARLHLKADTGMSRGGATLADWPELVAAALDEQAAGRCEVVGLWSHFACADIPGHPSVDAQLDRFRGAVEVAEQAGARPSVRHIANTAALLTRPDTWFDLVRPGGGVVGLCTLPGGPPDWLRPAMTVRTPLVQVKRVPAGSGVSYGHRYVTPAPANLGLIGVGYHEGIPRSAANAVPLLVRGERRLISGTVCMNQCVIDAGDLPIEVDDEVVLFGPGDHGEPTAQEWADLLDTISYDVVTRFTAKIPRSYCGVTEAEAMAVYAADGADADAAELARVGVREGLWSAGGGSPASLDSLRGRRLLGLAL